jgi:hypothetical protein
MLLYCTAITILGNQLCPVPINKADTSYYKFYTTIIKPIEEFSIENSTQTS